MAFFEEEQTWERRQQRAVFTKAAIEEASRDRAALAPAVDSGITNAIEKAMVEASHTQTTAAMLQGETEDEDESFAALAEEARVELRALDEGDYEVLTGFGPAPGGLLKWVLRYTGVEYILGMLGIPTPVRDLLNMAGESFGLEALAGMLPFVGEPRVAIYMRGNLLGVLDLASWADLRSSMKRVVWGQIRVRMEDA